MTEFRFYHVFRTVDRLLNALGFDLRKFLQFLIGLPAYIRDYFLFISQSNNSCSHFKISAPFPCLTDRSTSSGNIRGHYFHQDLFVASRIYADKPELHVDVGSRVDGFVAHVASFRQIEVIDVRPLDVHIHNVKFVQADLMRVGDSPLVDYCDSLSCLHTLEHFGLGRYGDTIDYDGHLAGFENLTLMLKRGGKLYLSVPIGPQRVEFNAHRVFSVEYMLGLVKGLYALDHFSYVDDRGELHSDVDIDEANSKVNFNCIYGCGIFELTKL